MRAASARGSTNADGDVLPFGDPELRLDQPLDRIREDEPDHEDRDGESDAEQSRRTARSGCRVTLRSTMRPAAPRWRDTQRRFEHRAAIAGRRFRPHRLRRRHAHSAAHGGERAAGGRRTRVSIVAPITTENGHAGRAAAESERTGCRDR